MAWEENSCISLNMQLIAILSRIGVTDALVPMRELMGHIVMSSINMSNMAKAIVADELVHHRRENRIEGR